jgi:uncharacterized RDD family membrane protein YckC
MRYYLYDAAAKKPLGPFSVDDLKKQPGYTAACFVAREGDSKWYHPAQSPELSPAVPPAPPSVPGAPAAVAAAATPAVASAAPEANLPPSKVLAGPWKRFCSCFLDSILLFCVVMALLLCRFGGPALSNSNMNVTRIGGWLVSIIYYVVLQSRIGGGQSLGQRPIKIRVVGRSGEPLSVGMSLLRYAVMPLAMMALGASLVLLPHNEGNVAMMFGGIIFLSVANPYLMLFNRNTGQAIYDVISGAYVVCEGREKNAAALPAIWSVHWALLLALLLLCVLGAYGFVSLLRNVSHVPLEQLFMKAAAAQS